MRLPALAAAIVALAAGSALAQEAPPAQPQPEINATTRVWTAPIGHRQPAQKDLPQGTTREEESNKAGSAARDFGTLRSICRGC